MVTSRHILPISPKEALSSKVHYIPQIVIETVNELIVKEFNNRPFTISQNTIIEKLIKSGMTRVEIFENNYLDIEEIYRQQGWTVVYDSPGWNENYDAVFKFSPK